MADDKRKADPKRRAINLIARFPFTDLALAVSRSGSKRYNFVQGFVNSSTALSYKTTRQVAHLIYCVEQPLFETPELGWPEIEKIILDTTPRHTVDINLAASKELYDLVRPMRYKAYQHPEQVLRIGLNRVISIGLDFYLVDNGRLVFQYPQPRQNYEIDGHVADIMMSILHHAYAQGDFSEARIELADLSATERGGKRIPAITGIRQDEILSLSRLNEEIEDVYQILTSLAAKVEV